MKQEIKIFFTALMFYTRIPCPKNIDHAEENLNKATRYFPLIGWIVGAISFIVFAISDLLFGTNVAVVLSFAAGVLTTGAFHEDGFGDVCDGFGGGWTKERILDIMKDSRVGAYAVIGLVLLFALKYFALNNLMEIVPKDYLLIFLFFINYHALSRFMAINISFVLPYSRADESSKCKPIAKAHGKVEVFGVYFFGLLPLVFLCLWHWLFAIVLLPLFLGFLYLKSYYNKWLDGYTGDCLGAAQQVAEILSLLTFLAVWKYM